MPAPTTSATKRLRQFETRLAWRTGLDHTTDDCFLWSELWEASRAVAKACDLSPDDRDCMRESFPVFALRRTESFAYLKERVAEWKAAAMGVARLPTTERRHRSEAEERAAPETSKKRRVGADRFNQAAGLAFIAHEVGRTHIGRVGHDKLSSFTQEHKWAKNLAADGPVGVAALVAEVRSWNLRYEAEVRRAIGGVVTRDMTLLADARVEERWVCRRSGSRRLADSAMRMTIQKRRGSTWAMPWSCARRNDGMARRILLVMSSNAHSSAS